MNVAIVGYGGEGQSSYAYYKALGATITIVDESDVPKSPLPKDVKTLFGVGVLDRLQGFDLVLRTPPISPARIKTDGIIWSATNEFFRVCPCPIIGVTGTKGKGTTATLIHKMLTTSGRTSHLVGNIGTPALSELASIKPDHFVVFELSSFQLWDLNFAPQVAVLLMVEAEHQDVHGSIEEYVAAKGHITLHQREDAVLIHHPTNTYVQQIVATSRARKIPFMQPGAAQVINDQIVIDEKVICSVSEVGLLGNHNLENVCAAVTAAWQFTKDIPAIAHTITSFKGLEHRLEFVAEKSGVRYFDDSQSTVPVSTIAALNSFAEKSVVILGGSDKGLDLTPVTDALDPEKHFAILIGKMSSQLQSQLDARSFTNYINLGSDTTMEKIVAEATRHATSGGVVLLSPACASFGMFKDYIDRGVQFRSAVEALA